MKYRTAIDRFRGTRGGFTFIEVLAAMLFMAIVIPVVLEALSVANRLGVVADRRRVAAQLADKMLTEKVVSGEWRLGGQQGDQDIDSMNYHWTLSTENWTSEEMVVVSVQVRFQVQGRDFDVGLSTLVSEESS